MSKLTPKEIIKKHKPLTPEELKNYKQKVEEQKAKYNLQMGTIEANLLDFVQRPKPVLDPETKKPILYIRDVSFEELKRMFPSDVLTYIENPEKIDPKKAEEYDEQFFKILAEIIVKPKKDWKFWKKIMNGRLMKLIQDEIVKMLEDIGVEMENFPKARKGK